MPRKLKMLLAICIYAMLIANVTAANYPALPQVYIQTVYNLPTGGQVIPVNTSSGFQAALNSANLGDVIQLQAGTIFTGPFTLPNKTTGSGWIYIISSAYSSLPPPCSRVSPGDSMN